mmetsp:Transcript_37412/g.86321  ORF Transcript_37412/g.86321 Transcript_37412/m.86321 type:complete len:117 (-) Transcript_37412:367-717(-)
MAALDAAGAMLATGCAGRAFAKPATGAATGAREPVDGVCPTPGAFAADGAMLGGDCAVGPVAFAALPGAAAGALEPGPVIDAANAAAVASNSLRIDGLERPEIDTLRGEPPEASKL